MMTFFSYEEAASEVPRLAQEFKWQADKMRVMPMIDLFYILDPWGSPV